MAQRKIFLSYSRKDQDLFDAFLAHLAPYESEGALLVRSEAAVLAGEDRDRSVHEMMDG